MKKRLVLALIFGFAFVPSAFAAQFGIDRNPAEATDNGYSSEGGLRQPDADGFGPGALDCGSKLNKYLAGDTVNGSAVQGTGTARTAQ